MREPDALAAKLRGAGLVVLAVTRHPALADVLVVYLHGNASQWVEGEALTTVGQVRGVVSVSQSLQTPAILLVRVRLNGRRGVGWTGRT